MFYDRCFVLLVGLALACSPSVQLPPIGDGPPDAVAPTTIPNDVGKICSAGCDTDLCIVTSYPDCASGDCLVDSRGGLSSTDAYCTGDCTNAACPVGFACQPVTDALTGQDDTALRSERRGSSDAGIPEAGTPDAGIPEAGVPEASLPEAAASCGLTSAIPACNACLEQSCCSDEASCANDADCSALLQCLGQCASGDTTCENDCASAHPTGTSLLTVVTDCLNAHCALPCAGGTPTISECFPTNAYASCDAYCQSLGVACTTTCSGANGGFSDGQAGLGYDSESDCEIETSGRRAHDELRCKGFRLRQLPIRALLLHVTERFGPPEIALAARARANAAESRREPT